MEAGREMDALIEEKLGFVRMETPEPYSTDISAAWLVVEKMHSNDWFFDTYDTSSHEFNVSFIYYSAGENVRGEACEKSMPLAICRAALKAVEAE